MSEHEPAAQKFSLQTTETFPQPSQFLTHLGDALLKNGDFPLARHAALRLIVIRRAGAGFAAIMIFRSDGTGLGATGLGRLPWRLRFSRLGP